MTMMTMTRVEMIWRNSLYGYDRSDLLSSVYVICPLFACIIQKNILQISSTLNKFTSLYNASDNLALLRLPDL